MQNKITELEKITNNHIKQNNTKVILIDYEKEYAIAALIFDNTPSLGIRWLNVKNGYPVSGWFIVPDSLDCSILDVIQLTLFDKKKIIDFLSDNNASILNIINIKTVVINRI
nr:hypothetical protein [Treponema sp.]